MEAAKTLLDRGYGKPETMSRVELSGSAKSSAIVFRWINEGATGNVEAQHEEFRE